MDTVSRLIVASWVIGGIGKVVTLGALTRSRMALFYPILTASLAIASLTHWYSLAALYTGGWAAYGRAWQAIQPFTLAATAAIALEAIYNLSAHFPRARVLTAIALVVLGTLSAAAVLPVASWVAPGMPSLAAVAEWILRRRNWSLCLLLVLVVSRLVAAQLEPRLRVNAARYATAGIVAIGSSVAGDFLIRAGLGYWGNAAGQFVLALPPLASLWLWSAMSGAGETYSPSWDAERAELQADMALGQFKGRARRAAAGRD